MRQVSASVEVPGRVPSWWAALWAVNAWFLLCTLYVGGGLPGNLLLCPFHLGNEMNVGSWWSGLQLLLFSLVAHSLAAYMSAFDRVASRAVFGLSLIGLGLFCDEIGGIHERAVYLVPFEGDLALLPFALAGGGVLAFSLWGLHTRRHVTGHIAPLVLMAFVCFGAVYLQEFAEHRVDWPRWSRGPRVALEEGTELMGFFLLLLAVTRLKQKVGSRRGMPRLPTRRTLLWFLKVSLLLAGPLLVVRSSFTAEQLDLEVEGDFGSLLPIAAYVAAALAAVIRGDHDPINRRHWWIVAAVLVLLSIDAQAQFHHYLFETEATRWRDDLGLLWGLPLLAAAVGRVPALRTGCVAAVLIVAYMAVALLALLSAPALALALAVTYLFSLAWLALILQIGKAETPSPLPPRLPGGSDPA